MSIDLSKAFAQWISCGTLVWNSAVSGAVRCGLEYAPGESVSEIVTGRGRAILLRPARRPLPELLRRKYPHLASWQILNVDFGSDETIREALTSPLIATQRDRQGGLVAATGVQIAGVRDDGFGTAAAEQLGPTWWAGLPRLAVWAPTARLVALKLYDTAAGASHQVIPMERDCATGIWSARGHADWKNRFYTFVVTGYAPSSQAIVTNEVTDPYSLALSADSGRSQLVDLKDPALAPRGWQTLPMPQSVRQDQASVYELHIRDFSASDATVSAGLRGTA